MLHTDRDGGHDVIDTSRAPETVGAERPADAEAPDASGGEPVARQSPAGEKPQVEKPQAEEKTAKPPSKEAPAPKKKGFIRRHPYMTALGLVVALLAAFGGYIYWDHTGHFESTDDAFIAARQFAIAPKVNGYLTAVPVTDNQHVAAGAIIAQIDRRDYDVALAEANAQVTAAQDSVNNIDAQIEVQQAQVTQGQAQVAQATAALTFAQEQAKRYENLAQTGSGTVQSAQQYTSALTQQQAALRAAEATLTGAQRQIAVLRSQRASAEANIQQAIAQRQQALLNISYATIRAAQPGRIVALSGAVGEFVTPGTALAMFVPDDIWVTANFKETQLDAMRPGQPAEIEIDAYPSHKFKGHVASVQPGSGTASSLLPAENATGNYVKIVQRVPVRIDLDNPPPDVALGPGMSVAPTVRINPAPSIYERWKAAL